MSSRLGHLAQDSLVQLRRSRDEFAGVGFVIAPELVITNAHVATDDIQVWVGGRQYACSSVRRYPDQGAQHPEWPFPDLAELVVPGLQAPPVLLGALTEQTHPPDEVLVPTFHIPSVQDSPDEPAVLHKRLSVHTTGGRWGVDGGVVRGMSGSPALDPETGRVCGMIKAHAWAAVDGGYPVPAGGWLIPFSPVHVPAPWFERNTAANPVGNRWRRIAAGADDIQRTLFEPDDAPGEITPANLLDPECGFAPFEPVAEFEELLRWCRSVENPLVRLVSGASGAGKSRIAVELCRRLRAEGWVAGFLGPRLDDRWRETFARAVRHELQVCVVVDDAEHRGEEIAAILHEARAVIAVMREHGLRPTVRVVLLSRNDPSRFETDLLAIDVIGDGFGRWIQSVLGTPVRLPPVLPGQEAVFRRAWHAYASRLGVSARAQPRWRHDLPGITTLEVYALAADAVLNAYFGDTWDGRLSDDPLGAIRRHHLRYWAQKLKRADYRLRRRTKAAARARPEAGSKSVEIPLDVAEAWLLVPTLAAASDRRHLRQVMRTVAKVLGHPGQDELKTLYRLYPKQDASPPSPDGRRPKPLPALLTPDRLAELMFREVCRSLGEVRLRDFLAAVLWLAAGTRPAGLPDDGRYAHPALRLIGRARTGGAAERDDPVYAKIDQALSALLAAHPRELLPALVKVAGEIPRAEPLVRLLGVAAQNCDKTVLPLVEPCLPDDGRGLSPVALTVLQRRVDAAHGSDDQAVADRVRLWRRMSLHLYHLDRHDGALRTNLDAINECRVLRHRGGGYARASAELFARLHGDRALFLLQRMLSGRQPDGEIGEALTYSEEAVRAYRDLGADYELALAGVLHNQNVLYARAGRLHQALAAGREALAVYGTTGPRRPRAAAHLHVAEDLADLGRLPEALAQATTSVAMFGELFEQAPSAHAADLMRALLQRAMIMQDVGENARVKRSPAVRGWLLRAETDLEQARQVSRSLPAAEPELVERMRAVAVVLDEDIERVGGQGPEAAAPPVISRQQENVVFSNEYGQLFDDDVLSPAGHPGRYLRWRWASRGVVAIPVLDGAAALVPAFRYPVGEVLLELPRGGSSGDEPPETAAIREVVEEVGVIGVTGRLLGTIYPDAGLIESGCAVVLVDVDPASAGRPAAPETMESIGQPRWLDRAAARAAIASGEIRCGVTLAALTLWWATTDQG